MLYCIKKNVFKKENVMVEVQNTPAHRHYLYEDDYSGEEIHFHFYNKVTTPLHSHNYFEIFVVTKGQVTHSYMGRTEKLEVGTICLIPPYKPHQCLEAEDDVPVHFNIAIPEGLFTQLCDIISPDALPALLKCEKFYRLGGAELEYVKHMAEEALASDEKSSALIAKTICFNLISHLLRVCGTDDACPAWLGDFCEKLKSPEYFLEPISSLYKLVPYSQPMLNAYFKQYTGQTLINYLTKLRINYAANLLSYSNYPIIDISYQTGYNSLSHFNHTFKKHTGLTPSEYRKKHRKYTDS